VHRNTLAAVALASLPLLCSLVLWAAWHFFLVPALFPLSLAVLAFPACLGYAAVLISKPAAVNSAYRKSWLLVFLAVILFAIAYACALYAWGSMQWLISEYYKFGAKTVLLSRSTIEIWVGLSIFTATIAFLIRRLLKPETLSQKLAISTIGMSSTTAVIFGAFLASGLVSYRP
jgi:hypothetical protein